MGSWFIELPSRDVLLLANEYTTGTIPTFEMFLKMVGNGNDCL